jgi:hypothetical protein
MIQTIAADAAPNTALRDATTRSGSAETPRAVHRSSQTRETAL